MGLDRRSTRTGREFGIHRTNDEAGIGSEASRGCVRWSNETVSALFRAVGVGTEVFICR
jgi:lipoprotein-anchoring transpeptidase ErfK/SrfK